MPKNCVGRGNSVAIGGGRRVRAVWKEAHEEEGAQQQQLTYGPHLPEGKLQLSTELVVFLNVVFWIIVIGLFLNMLRNLPI